MQISEILPLFDQYLTHSGLRFNAVVLGGAALDSFNNVFQLPKEDFDILYPEIPKEIADASRAFAIEVRLKGKALGDAWLNNGSASFTNHLRPQWKSRLQTLFVGSSLEFQSLGRCDLLCAKLFVLCDCGIGFGDCVALSPSAEDLASVLPWLEEQHANPFWPKHVRTICAHLGRTLGH